MASAAAALLDQLMGSTRDASAGDNVRETAWSDPQVCKSYLCGFCPSELFTNTRADMGQCPKKHDEKLKNAYERDPRYKQVGLEQDFLQQLERIVRDLDRKIVRGRERLRRSADAKRQDLSGEGAYTSEKLKNLNAIIDETHVKLELLGARGLVEEAQSLMVDLERLVKERDRERHSLSAGTNRTLAGYEVDTNDFHEKMELCDACGSFLVIGDTQGRVDAHLLGKQHMGFSRIRSAISELRKANEEQRLEKLKERERRLSQRTRSPTSPVRSKRSRSHSRSRPEGGRRSSRRSRSRDRERRRQPSRSRSRGRRRSGSRGRDRRRSGSRGRDRRRSGSRDRDRKRRSRSRDRHGRRSHGSRERRRASRSPRSRERGSRRHSSSERRRSRDHGEEDGEKKKKEEGAKEENGKQIVETEDGDT